MHKLFCVFLCGCTAVVCACVYITSDEILSLLSASIQHKCMSIATSHKSRGMHRERKRERFERRRSSLESRGVDEERERARTEWKVRKHIEKIPV